MGQDRFKLTIELVPRTVWFTSLYQYYNQTHQLEQWYALKQALFTREGNRCWICGQEQGRFEAHEFWIYDDAKQIQKLTAIHHLCGRCHKIKHIGFWCYTKNGQRKLANEGLTREDLIRHFCQVNICSREDFESHEVEVFRIWRVRSQHEWQQDLGKYTPTLNRNERD